ncbi:MAG: recombination protein O N-terminal domain-containing protein [bacterium]
MRHKYGTSAIVLARAPLSEDSALVTLLTTDLGLVRARAQGLRKPGAKLAAALQTLSESEVILVRGKDAWRLSGAVLSQNRFQAMPHGARLRAARVSGLILRLVAGESADPALYAVFSGFLEALASRPESEHDAAECLAALRILRALGLDAGAEAPGAFGSAELAAISANRSSVVSRINRGLTASGL